MERLVVGLIKTEVQVIRLPVVSVDGVDFVVEESFGPDLVFFR